MMVYQISKGCLAFMYMQHKHMVYGEFHLHQYLVLGQDSNINAYSTPLRYEVWNVDHKEVMLFYFIFKQYILTYWCGTSELSWT